VTGRDRIVILVVLALGAVAAGWLLVVSPKRQEAASLSTQITAQQSQLDTLRSQVSAGETARTAFAGQYAQLARLGEAVPPDDDVPSLIYQVQSAAQAAKVSFRGLQLTGGGGSSAPSTPSTPGSSSTRGASAGSAAGAGALPPGASVGAAGLPTEQFAVSLSGNYFRLANFFNRLQNFVSASGNTLLISGRLMTINGISLTPAASGFPQINASISATTYIVPATQGAFAGATPAGPATAPQAHTSNPGSSTGAPAAVITSPLR
jgi:hypothetical protein